MLKFVMMEKECFVLSKVVHKHRGMVKLFLVRSKVLDGVKEIAVSYSKNQIKKLLCVIQKFIVHTCDDVENLIANCCIFGTNTLL